ncbi:hypothetical protein [Vibrio fluvialis]|uniref:hypothetical protein n=1 Tax=Vibrio fluvialis TaxID=676 RepID=UPI0015588B0B|nr:hypothetical protein [Vibrio fluvialis]
MSTTYEKVLKVIQGHNTTDVNKAAILRQMDSYQQFTHISSMIRSGIENLEVSPALIKLIGLDSAVDSEGYLQESIILQRLNEIEKTFKQA